MEEGGGDRGGEGDIFSRLAHTKGLIPTKDFLWARKGGRGIATCGLGPLRAQKERERRREAHLKLLFRP